MSYQVNVYSLAVARAPTVIAHGRAVYVRTLTGTAALRFGTATEPAISLAAGDGYTLRPDADILLENAAQPGSSLELLISDGSVCPDPLASDGGAPLLVSASVLPFGRGTLDWWVTQNTPTSVTSPLFLNLGDGQNATSPAFQGAVGGTGNLVVAYDSALGITGPRMRVTAAGSGTAHLRSAAQQTQFLSHVLSLLLGPGTVAKPAHPNALYFVETDVIPIDVTSALDNDRFFWGMEGIVAGTHYGLLRSENQAGANWNWALVSSTNGAGVMTFVFIRDTGIPAPSGVPAVLRIEAGLQNGIPIVRGAVNGVYSSNAQDAGVGVFGALAQVVVDIFKGRGGGYLAHTGALGARDVWIATTGIRAGFLVS